jgi:hypothetical protein
MEFLEQKKKEERSSRVSFYKSSLEKRVSVASLFPRFAPAEAAKLSE